MYEISGLIRVDAWQLLITLHVYILNVPQFSSICVCVQYDYQT